jgi:hypothetical protein
MVSVSGDIMDPATDNSWFTLSAPISDGQPVKITGDNTVSAATAATDLIIGYANAKKGDFTVSGNTVATFKRKGTVVLDGPTKKAVAPTGGATAGTKYVYSGVISSDGDPVLASIPSTGDVSLLKVVAINTVTTGEKLEVIEVGAGS